MTRTVLGRLRGHYRPGTILGPNAAGEYVVALAPETIDDGAMYWAPLDTDALGTVPVEPHTWHRITPEYTEFGYATVKDLAAADARPEPWSVAEARRKPVRGEQ